MLSRLCGAPLIEVQKIAGGCKVIYPNLGLEADEFKISRHSDGTPEVLATDLDANNAGLAGSCLQSFRVYHSQAGARMWSVVVPKIPGRHESLTRYIPAPLGFCRIPRCQGVTLFNGPRVLETRSWRIQAVPGRIADVRRLHCRFQGVFDSFIGPG